MTALVEFVRREDPEKVFEQIVFCEVMVPNQINTWGDFSTPEMVRNCAYAFAQQGYGLDIGHDNVDVTGTKLVVVESFIARAGDPDFIEGSWVVGMKILDDETWAQVLAGELNGFSFEAEVFYTDMTYDSPGTQIISGMTEPDPFDGHTHTFTVVIGPTLQVISGGTGVTDGHSHTILSHTYTEESDDHKHWYQVVED